MLRANGDGIIGAAVNKDIFIGNKEKKGDDDFTVNFNRLRTLSSTVSVISFGKHFFAASCEDKSLTVWQVSDWSTVSHCSLPKKITSLLFSNEDEFVLTADKSGQVIRYSIKTLQPVEQQLLGHSSMLLDMALLHGPAGEFIGTCDRDEKIRISCYPNCYNINSYCLGHLDFVSRLCICPSFPSLLLSGAADNKVIVWDWFNGKVLHSVSIVNDDAILDKEDLPIVTNICCTGTGCSLVAITTSKTNSIYLYNLTESGFLNSLSTLEVSGIPLSITFDVCNQLWVLCPRAVHCYLINGSKVDAAIDDSLVDLLNDVVSKNNVEGLVSWSSLRKREFDNMSAYFSKKSERIESSKKIKLEDTEEMCRK